MIYDRRNDPRIPIHLIGSLAKEENCIEIQLNEISTGGFSFMIMDDTAFLSCHRYRFIVYSTELEIEAEIQITHRTEIGMNTHYGAEIISMNREHLNRLRRFIHQYFEKETRQL